jgi:hypothetical protein
MALLKFLSKAQLIQLVLQVVKMFPRCLELVHYTKKNKKEASGLSTGDEARFKQN